jgi:hypothetical protein
VTARRRELTSSIHSQAAVAVEPKQSVPLSFRSAVIAIITTRNYLVKSAVCINVYWLDVDGS